MRAIGWAGLLAVAAVLAGCQGGGRTERAAGTGPAPFVIAEEAEPIWEDRRIGPQDLLVISIVGDPSLQTEYRVSSSGSIQFPYLGLVRVGGLTPDELKAHLEELLSRDHYRNPEVIVTVREYRPQYVRVLGAVNRPGLVDIRGDRRMDILDVIAASGGTTRLARNRVEYTHRGQRRVFSLDALHDPANTIYVQPGDIIAVPESSW